MLWLALHFPHLSIELLAQHNESGQPIVVVDNNRVCATNEAANDQGISLGTTLATAHSICPTVLHQVKDTYAEARRLDEIADHVYRFSSLVSIQQPDCVLLEIGGSLRLFGQHQMLEEQVFHHCRSMGHSPTARVARTPWAAIALARSGARNLSDVPLATAGVELAGVRYDVVEQFENMGIYTLGALLDLPSNQLGKRFGKNLQTYLARLIGDVADPRRCISPSECFERQSHLLQPLQNKSHLIEFDHSPMRVLVKELYIWLRNRHLACEQIEWQFYSHNRATKILDVHFAHGLQSATDILRITSLRLDDAELPAEVLGIGLCARQTKKHEDTIVSLFSDRTRPPAAGFDIVDELAARLGEDACQTIRSLDHHAPESGWLSTRLHGSQQPRDLAKISSQRPQRPLWLFDQPRQIEFDDLEILHGPERIQSNWWQGKPVARDYFVARHRLGAECWAFVDADDRWFLHGYFS